jgi:membrane-bound lytic murein transglycosylase D
MHKLGMRWLAFRSLGVVSLLACSHIASAGPNNDDLIQRRSIRGKPVEALHESESLRQIREFEESAFPAPNPLAPDFDKEVPPPPPSLGVGPDAIPDTLRSPPRLHEAAPPPETSLPWLRDVKLPDFAVRWDPRVLRYLDFYKNDKRGRAIMAGWLRAQARWRPMFEDALKKAHLPLGLIYVSMIESGYDPHDKSHAGAVGLWQFMPENSKIYGLRVNYWVDERRDPEKSTEAAMRYLGDLKERFGAWPLALAAFNAGYGAVLRAMQKYNTNDYWELCRHEDGLPWDTVLYVPKWMATVVVGENRKLFGYDSLPGETPYSFDVVTVKESIGLAAAARAAGVPAAALEALNPELRRKRTPPEPWRLRLPRGSGPRFASSWDPRQEKVKPFVVRFGERLDDLARAFGLTEKQLRALNGIEDSSEIVPGLTLVVPESAKPPPAPTNCDTVLVAVPDKDAVVAGRKRLFYRTLPQDGLHEIANFFNVKPTELAAWNHVDLEARLASNMILQVWVDPGFDESRAALVDPSRVRLVTTGSEEFFELVEARRGRARLSYTVKKGDDWKRIGRKFGLTVADLERINRVGAQHTDLHIGQKITVYREMSKAEKEKAACKIAPSPVIPKAVAIAPISSPVPPSPVAAQTTDSSATQATQATPTATQATPTATQATPSATQATAAKKTSEAEDEAEPEDAPAAPPSLPRPPPADGRP